jgi:uncharacterized protein (TIGR03435 family)
MRQAWVTAGAAIGLVTSLIVVSGARIELQAQDSKPLAFEVASVKPSLGSSGVTGGCHGAPSSVFNPNAPGIPNGRCVIAAARLSHIIPIAYDIPISRVKGGPEWVWGVPRFNIEAKAEDSTATYAELMRMLQTLLADRFKLRIHREMRPVSGYALVVAPNGPKLRESGGAEEPALTIMGAAINKFDAIEGRNLDLNTLRGRRMTMAQLAEALSRLPGNAPVIDRTGLTGQYDFSLSWEPDENFAAVLAPQLGLRAERQDVPVDFIIIDGAEPPGEN